MSNDEFKKTALKKEDCLTFHVIQEHNFEDTYPYIDDELLVVCDGCGGAGSSKHTIKKEDVDSYEKLRDIVLPEDKDELLKDYMMHENVFLPVVSDPNKTQVRTSAFLGSRTVMSRFVYAHKTLPGQDKDEIRDFVLKGMNKLSSRLNLELDKKNPSVALLSTTFVAIAINGESDTEVDVDVYWAGDSRAYYFTMYGLQQLSLDDEDEGGGLTNLYCLSPRFNTHINHRHYVLKKPCLLFTCSDGLFDALKDTLEVEYALLHYLNECDSMESLKEHLVQYYDYIKCDDTTMALRQFGYQDYNEIKGAFAPRLKYVENLYSEKNKYARAYSLKRDRDDYNNVIRLLTDTVEEKQEQIFSTIANAYNNKIDDPFIKKCLIYKVENRAKNQVATDGKSVYKKLVPFMKNFRRVSQRNKDKGVEEIDKITKIFKRDSMSPKMKKAFDSINLLTEQYLVNRQKEELASQIHAVLIRYYYDIASLLGVKPDASHMISGSFVKGVTDKLSSKARTLLKKLEGGEELLNKYDEIDSNLKKLNKKIDELPENEEEVADRLFDEFELFIDYIDGDRDIKYISYDRLGMEAIASKDKKEKKEENVIDINNILLSLYGNKEGRTNLVLDRIALLDERCCFDDYFHEYFLKSAIEYQKASLLDEKEVNGFISEYDGYNDFVKEKLKDE